MQFMARSVSVVAIRSPSTPRERSMPTTQRLITTTRMPK